MKKLISLLSIVAILGLAASAQDSLYVTTSDSVKLFVQKSGKGFPVLFIHGGPGSNSGYFEYGGGNVFEKDVQMIYLDQRGCGRSDNAANKDYSLNRIVKDFEEVRKALGIQQWIIMPHSFGGILATEYATQYPSAIKAMVYLNCTINIDHSAKSGIKKTQEVLKERNINYPELNSDTIPLLQRWGMAFGKLNDLGLFYTIMFDTKESFAKHDSITQEYAKHYEMSQTVWNRPEYFKDFSQKTASLKMPVLIITGTRDYTIGLDHPKLMKFPNKEIKYVEGGHAIYFEHTKELYDAVSPFLKKYSKMKLP